MSEKTAEEMKFDQFYGDAELDLDEEGYEEDICIYTGEPCIGDCTFCEECPVLIGGFDEEEE